MSANRVLVAMSGGVDSSVTTALLKDQGYEIVGVTMKLFPRGEAMPGMPECPSQAIRDAATVAECLGFPHHVLNLSDEFEKDVISSFVSEYERGRTPIPCVRCNSRMKFKALMEYAEELSCNYVATGHYAILDGGYLYRGRDREKEQTYFLWEIERDILDRVLLPLGRFTKSETRHIARSLGLANSDRPESVEICFVPDNDYVQLLTKLLTDDSPALQAGPILTTGGEVVGEHQGYARYTVGQRRGLPGGFSRPMYVTKIVPRDRTVMIGPESELFSRNLRLVNTNWLAREPRVGDMYRVSTRYRSRLVNAVVRESARDDGGQLVLELADAIRAITPGQSGVLYDEDERLVGGGVIQ